MEAGNAEISPLIQALRRAERQSGVEIHVHLSDKPLVRVARKEAERWFRRHGLDRNPAQAGLLIYLNPRSRLFSIVAGPAWDQWISKTEWNHFAKSLREDLLGTYWERALAIAVNTLAVLIATKKRSAATPT